MQAHKISKPSLAFAFKVVANGTNFDELTADVVANGGTVEKLNDDKVAVALNGRSSVVPLGYVLVVDGGNRTLMSYDQFDDEYVVIDGDDDTFDIDDIFTRLDNLEKTVAGLSAKSSGKKKADKAETAQVDEPVAEETETNAETE